MQAKTSEYTRGLDVSKNSVRGDEGTVTESNFLEL